MLVVAVSSHLKDSPELDLDHWSRLWLQACRKNKVGPRDAGQSSHPETASSGEEEEDCMMNVSPLL
jgi:hypothetical protein